MDLKRDCLILLMGAVLLSGIHICRFRTMRYSLSHIVFVASSLLLAMPNALSAQTPFEAISPADSLLKVLSRPPDP